MNRPIEKITSSVLLKTAVSMLRAVAHPLRIKLLTFIEKHEPVNVNVIYRELQLDQSVASQHLKILRDQQLVCTTRKGKYIFYSLNREKLKRILEAVYDFTG